MNNRKRLRVSIVIPVYNEVDHLAACLAAIATQTVQPYEVIVVDNNSTDDSALIARQFPFVRLIRETRQGVVYARDTGFRAAGGEIIGRIDADTIIDTDWVATLRQLFADHKLGAVSGKVAYQDVVAARFVGRVDLFWRRRMARLLSSEVALQGANMAIRRATWQAIQAHVCHQAGMHEDFDIAIHANQSGWQVRFDEHLKASVCYRQADYSLRQFSNYALISPRTYLRHGLKSGRHMYQVVAFVIICYPLIKLLHRSYDRSAAQFSWANLLGSATTARVNPATFVD